ncbi:hypothetical protein ABQJ54_18140 [Rhodanobacter sp. Si-c]|uniref:Uncharacterized protein n=1 Tax=Rhodanobacter lycopersici TaxID=3162487 RepID=A0ABV3QIK3_9GAMM
MSMLFENVNEANVARLRSRLVGASIMAVGGTAWIVVALIYWQNTPAWALPTAIVVGVALLGVCIARFLATRRIRSVRSPTAAAADKRSHRRFLVVFAAEIVGIIVSANVLAYLGYPLWIPVAVALIVGAHFLPLARVFAAPIYYGTGTVSVLGVLGCLLIHDVAVRLLGVGLTMAVVLWITSSLVLWRTRQG